MEAEVKTKSLLKRKPLSDCTNTSARRKPPKSSISVASTTPPKSSISIAPTAQSKPHKTSLSIPALQSKPHKTSLSIPALHSKPTKSSVSIPAAQIKPPKTSISVVAAAASSSVKTQTSTGSNASPDAPSVPTHSLPPLSHDDRNRRDAGLAPTQSHQHDAKARKDKAKMVIETPITKITNPFTPRTLKVASTAADDRNRRDPGFPATQSHQHDAKTRKDKGKMVVETPIIEISNPFTPRTLKVASTATDDRDRRDPGLPATQSCQQDAKTRKDKGKMVVETPNVQISNPLKFLPNDRDRRDPELNASQSHQQDAKIRKGKGKMVVDTPIIEISNPFTPRMLKLSSTAPDNLHFSGPPAIRTDRQDAPTWKNEGKLVTEASNIEASDPMTSRAALISSSSASGIHDQERVDSLTVYNQRRSPRRRKHADGKTVVPFSCPPRKRTKKKGMDSKDDGGHKQLGSHTDPLPLHKKRRSRNKQCDFVHAMPQDEIERLKSYYADIDAFELPEEVASERD